MAVEVASVTPHHSAKSHSPLIGVIFNGNGHGVSTVKWPKSHLDCDQSKSELFSKVSKSEKIMIRLKHGR